MLFPLVVCLQLQWDATVVDSFYANTKSAGSVCSPGTAMVEAEDRKSDKYRDLINHGCTFFNQQLLNSRVPPTLALRFFGIIFIRTCACVARNPWQVVFLSTDTRNLISGQFVE